MMLKINYDALGITASLACAIHCAVLPLILSSLPIFGIDIIHNYFFEFGMIGLAFVVGLYALYHGYKKHHHKFLPALIFTAGISFLLLKEIFHDYHVWLLIPAVVLIVSAHYINYRLCRKANHCHSGDCDHH
ncbi:MAG: MerC domain-containing protein [Chitinophagaceae bacterium]|nr:MerC domain-containing protein [Chitinophagaceae bacterium]